MARGTDVLQMLRPNGGWVIYGDDFDSILWIECEPLTRQQFIDGFAQADIWLAEKQTEIEQKRLAAEQKLAALGLTAEDLKVLGII